MTEQKRLKIKQSLNKTKSKRSSQQCCVYKVKIQYNKLSKLQQQQLKMLFVEGKWFYNYLLNQQNIFKINTTNIKSIIHYDKNKQQINSQIRFIGSSIKQSILEQIKSSIKSLSAKKKSGVTVGKLKHINQLKSINLTQYKNNWNIKNNKIHIQGIRGYIKVNGLQRIDIKNIDIANAKLLNTPTGYYLAITTYRNKAIKDNSNKPNIGIDFGCSTSFTLSNGQKYDHFIEETERLKRLHRALQRKKKNSNNRRKLISKIRKQYQKLFNKKLDKTNKFIHYLKQNFNQIHIQDEQIQKWKQNNHGKSIQHDILGLVKSKLSNLDQVKIIDKFIPTTKTCSNCGYKQDISLYQRVYKCPNCGLVIDRDINSAINILNSSPTEYRLNACNTRSIQSLD